MLKVKIIAVGKIKEKYLQEGIKEYSKRLNPYVRLEILEVLDEPCPERLSLAEEEIVKVKEGERILKVVSRGDYVILLDIEGKMMESPDLSRLINDLALQGKSSLCFIIGGSLGVSGEVYRRSDFKWSFSRLTFPHQLMRLSLLEQIYRSIKISAGEAYHVKS